MNKPNGYFYYSKGTLRYVDNGYEYKVTKEQVNRFRSVVDSNPGKWVKGEINEQIIDKHCFLFTYNNYDDDPVENLYMIVRIRYRAVKNGR